MALLKEIETPSGVIASYWRVGSYLVEKNIVSKIETTILGYSSQESRENGKIPLLIKRRVVINVDPVNGVTIQEIYNYLKTTPDFLDAEDI